ncbi:MAG: hypothetical protein ABEK01_01205 [Candidatus Nanohaloarchaea archaeon]
MAEGGPEDPEIMKMALKDYAEIREGQDWMVRKIDEEKDGPEVLSPPKFLDRIDEAGREFIARSESLEVVLKTGPDGVNYLVKGEDSGILDDIIELYSRIDSGYGEEVISEFREQSGERREAARDLIEDLNELHSDLGS